VGCPSQMDPWSCPSRENIGIFDFELSAADAEDITVLNKNERTGPDPDKFDGRSPA
jgi:diketogulonate reductase-like aldo/keto reductase